MITNQPDISQYPTEKLLEDRREFELGAGLCRTAMLFDVLVARTLEGEPAEAEDYLSEANELIDVLRENLQAIQLIDQELALRLKWGIISPEQYPTALEASFKVHGP